MRKLFFAAALGTVVLLVGCSAEPEGCAIVREAKEKYESLDSAKTVMTDISTGEQIMEFSFFFNANDEMVLSYYGRDGEDETYAYSNGAEFYYKEAGDEKWSLIGTDDEYYIYNLYNREYRYPYAEGGIFFLDAGSVETADVVQNADGSYLITYVYAVDKLNESTKGLLDGVSSFDALTTTFEINADGYITEFTEVGTVVDAQGETTDVNMCISVELMNEVYDIPYPVDRLDK